ncbi:protein lethal(2)essential for life-like [Argiope bruennichi]|uniref:Protein lethal(2)essential for life like protein n=1 Tax=Argiope bruennichi TaxID=94029 RepID=A0A8T0FGX7_ARGBR|nr:protein lethal(2)essential for life-like [Argiope bruennichi]KAF8789652.1 Protein lethal(2)essential for life like protein [Argiope bruennichi]
MSLSSLFPLMTRGWWDSWDYPTRIPDQHFGAGLLDSDLLPPSLYGGFLLRPRTQLNIDSSGQSEVQNEADKFKVMLNVSQFKPNEIDVKTVDNFIVIHGKHEERTDEHGFVSREFTRRYLLPEGTEPETVKSSLSQDGILTIEAPKKAIEPPPSNERVVPITLEKPAVGN